MIDKKILSSVKILGTATLVLLIAIFVGQSSTQAISTFRTETGTYIGNGTIRTIVGLGFSPDSIMIKGDDDKLHTVYSTSAMPTGFTFYFGKGGNSIQNGITSIDNNGFSVGSNKDVNKDGITFYWTASGGTDAPGFKVGSYIGDDTDIRSIMGLGFEPATLWIKGDNNRPPIDLNFTIPSVPSTYPIQSLDEDGFTINDDKSVNAKKTEYYYIAFGQVGGLVISGAYQGDGQAFKQIIEPNFFPKWVGVKSGDSLDNSWHRNNAIKGDLSHPTNKGSAQADYISGFSDVGFSVGSGLNNLGENYFWVALTDPALSLPTDGSSGGGAGANVQPKIESIFPTSGLSGNQIIIYGQRFGDEQVAGADVYFNDIVATDVVEWTNTQITVLVPPGDVAGDLIVVTANRASYPLDFGVPPIVKSLNPSSAVAGNRISIMGSCFGQHRHGSTVTIGGIEVTKYVRWTNEKIVVEVPEIDKDSLVQVITQSGVSNEIILDAALEPVIDTISHTSLQSGDYLTITGSNFGEDQFDVADVIFDDDIKATKYLVWSNNSILVQLPLELKPGRVEIFVRTAADDSNSKFLRVTKEPVIKESSQPLIGSVTPNPIDISQLDEVDYTWTVSGANFSDESNLQIQFYNNDAGWIDTKILDIELSESNKWGIRGYFVDVEVMQPTKLVAGRYHVVVTNKDFKTKGIQEDALTILDVRIPDESLIMDEEIDTDVLEPEEDEFTGHHSDSISPPADSSAFNFLLRDYNQLARLFRDFWDDLVSRFSISQEAYKYEIVSVSPSSELIVLAGELFTVEVIVQNKGILTWHNSGEFHLHIGTNNPRDRKSAFASPEQWLEADNRGATFEENNAEPGEIGTFLLELQAPNVPGTYLESFGIVAEYFTWLSGPDINLEILVQ